MENLTFTYPSHTTKSCVPLSSDVNIIKNADNLYITFHSEYPSWVITTFASLGEKAEIISPNSLRTEVKDFLKNALKQYEI